MTQALTIGWPQMQAFLLLFLRISGMLAAWPITGSRNVPAQVKVVLAVMLTVVLLPIVRIPGLPSDATIVTLGMMAEFLVGFVIGLAVRLLFAGLDIAGELMSVQMGFGVVQLFDPTTQQQMPLMAHFQTMIASLVFVSLNAHHLVVQAVAHSFDVIPPFGAGLSAGLLDGVLRMSRHMFVLAITLAAPVLATILVLNLILAMLGRAVAQINVFLLSFPITIAAGLVMFGLALPAMARIYEHEFVGLTETIQQLLSVLGHG